MINVLDFSQFCFNILKFSIYRDVFKKFQLNNSIKKNLLKFINQNDLSLNYYFVNIFGDAIVSLRYFTSKNLTFLMSMLDLIDGRVRFHVSSKNIHMSIMLINNNLICFNFEKLLPIFSRKII